MKQTAVFTVSVHDEDAFCNMRASAVLRKMQECANMHLQSCRMPNGERTVDEMARRNRAFILCKIHTEAYAPLHAYDEIRVESWVKEEKGVTIERLYKIFKGEELVAQGASLWAILENASKIVRVSEYADGSTHDEDTCDVTVPKHFKLPCDIEYEYAGEKTVLYSDIDLNGHLNNTNYPDMYMSFIPEMKYERGTGQRGAYVSDMLINFITEAPLGCTVKIYIGRSGGNIYVRTERDDGKVNTEAVITLKDA